MKENGTVQDVDAAAEEMLASVDSAFAPLGVQAGIEKKLMVKKVANTELCPRCSKPLEGRVMMAMDQKWHIDCFCCSQCDRPIEDGFTVRQGKPWCQKCIDWSTEKPLGGTAAPPKPVPEKKEQKNIPSDVDALQGFQVKYCDKCSQKIIIGVDYQGQSFCADCFTCYRCKAPIDTTEGFLPVENKVYCSLCAHAATGPTQAISGSPCYGCGQPIDRKFVKADGKTYHADCFKCSNCGGSLAQGYAVKGKDKLCASCASNSPDVTAESVPLSKPISGIRIDQRTFKVSEAQPAVPKEDTGPKFCFQCGAKCEGKRFCPGCGIKVN